MGLVTSLFAEAILRAVRTHEAQQRAETQAEARRYREVEESAKRLQDIGCSWVLDVERTSASRGASGLAQPVQGT